MHFVKIPLIVHLQSLNEVFYSGDLLDQGKTRIEPLFILRIRNLIQMQFITFAASSIIDLNDQNSEPVNVESFDADKLTVYLDLNQSDLITCLLLDQLVKIESAEGELNPLMNSYADLLVQVKSGNVGDSRFLEELESLKEVIKDQPKYVTIIDTIIALWNV